MEEFDPGDEGYWEMEEFENDSKSYECDGKLNRIWRCGVSLGKKMVITGAVVSSAPFVLPPLVALSAIGVAFSVPAGFVFATYACGEKLMNTLLPLSAPYEGSRPMFLDEEEYKVYGDSVGMGYEEDESLGYEEHEFEEDVKKELEMRIEFVEESNEEFNDHDVAPCDMDELEIRSSSQVSEIIEEGYEGNAQEYLIEEKQPRTMDSRVCWEKLGGITEVETEVPLMEKERGWVQRVVETFEIGYEEDVGEYMADDKQSIDAQEFPQILEVMIKEAENEISLMEKEEDRLLRVSDIFEAGYKKDAGEYMTNEEQPLDIKATPEILEGTKEVENDLSLMEKEDDRVTKVSEIIEEGYEEDVGEYMSDEEQPVDAEAIPEILEGMNEMENEGIKEMGNDISLMEKEEGLVPRVSETVEEGYEEDVGEYMANVEQPRDSKEIPEVLEGNEEAENEIFVMDKKEDRVPKVSEIIEEGYEEDVEEYMENEEQPLDAKKIPDILEGIHEAENEISLSEKEESQGPRLSEVAVEGYEENVGEHLADEEQFLDAKEISETLEGMKEAENVNSSMEKHARVPSISEIGEEEFKDVGEYMSDEEQPLDKKVPEEIKEEANEISLMEKEEGGMPRDSLSSVLVAAQLGGENEINVIQVAEVTTFVPSRDIKEANEFAGVEEDKVKIEATKLVEYDQKRKDSPVSSTKGNVESGIVPVKDASQDKGSKSLSISNEVEPAMDDRGLKTGLESEKIAEKVTEEMSFVQPRNIDEGNGFSGIEPKELRSETTGLIEKMRDEGKADQKRKDSPAKEISAGNEESGIVSVKDMSQNNKGVEPAAANKGVVIGVTNENNVEQVPEDMAFVSSRGANEESGFAVEKGIELRSEMMKLFEKLRDEGNDDQKRNDSATKETPEENVESVRVFVKDMSVDKGSPSLTDIPKGPKPAAKDKGEISHLKSEENLENASIERNEPKPAVKYQLVVTEKIDDDHTVTEVYQGTGSDVVGNLIISNEDTTETTAESGLNLFEIRTVTPHQIVDSFNKKLEGEDQSLNKVEVTQLAADYHEVVIESIMPASELLGEEQSLNNMAEVTVDFHEVVTESTVPVSEHAETTKDQGTTTGFDKIKQEEEEKIWEEINAMRTIVGYTNTPHHTCAEELKALYDFTGVELPTSSNDSSDLADINEKLHFLMSIIGVK